ncbi:MAG: TatD family hydrolase [Candidatus Moranbacteria bacterium]|nr:TatD family hydrolase [Candidatus Moranbacteria bacterium]
MLKQVQHDNAMLIDTHAHVNFKAFREDADEVLKRALDNDVLVINVGSQYSTSQRAVEIAERYESGVWAAVGIHPLHLEKSKIEYSGSEEWESEEIILNGENFDYDKYRTLTLNSKMVAIGEMGLDYHHFEESDNVEELKKKQKKVFLEGIRLANGTGKPMIIHCWDAYDDLYEILENNPVEKRGVIHSFVGGYKTARQFTELSYKIGLNGVITYSNSFNRLIKEVALENVLLETDCPYLAPVPKKGERNEPVYVKYTAQKIAEVKNLDVKEIAKITTQNARILFNL